MLGGSDDGGERHLGDVVDAAQVVGGLVGQRRELVEEPGLHVLLRQPVEERLHPGPVTRPGRPQQHPAAVAQLDLALLLDRVGAVGCAAPGPLRRCRGRGPPRAGPARSSGCAISIRATARSASERPKRYAVPYSVTTQRTSERGSATGSSGPRASPTAGRPPGLRDARQTTGVPCSARSAPAMEVGPGGDTAVEHPVEPLGAHLPGEVDRERLGHRHHPPVAGDDLRGRGRARSGAARTARRRPAGRRGVACPWPSSRPRGRSSHRPRPGRRPASVTTSECTDSPRRLPQMTQHLGRAPGRVPPAASTRGRPAARRTARSARRRRLGSWTYSVTGVSTGTAWSMRSTGTRPVPRARGIAGLTSATTVRAESTAARVMSTDTPRLHVPSASGGATCTSATSIGRWPSANIAGTSASDTGT